MKVLESINEELIRAKIVSTASFYIGVNISDHNDFRKYIDLWLDMRRPAENNEKWAWCSAFLIGVFKDLGCNVASDLSARSWLKIGDKVDNPSFGDIVIFWRENVNSWKGHVGVYLGIRDNKIICLGGNQSGKVSVVNYSKNRVLGYRSFAKFIPQNSWYLSELNESDVLC